MKRWIHSRAVAAVLVGLFMILMWDVLWCLNNSFRGMSFVETYVNTLLLSCLLALPTALGARRGWQLALWLVALGFMESNLMYCRTYMTWIPLDSYLLAGHVMDFAASITASLRWFDLILPLIALGGFFLLGRNFTTDRKPYWITTGVSAVAAVVFALCNGGFPDHVYELTDRCYLGTQPPVIYTLAGTAVAEALAQEDTLSDHDRERVEAWLAEQERRVAAYEPPQYAPRKNLVIVFCESMESWLVGATVNEGKELTPFLNELVADSTTLFVPHVTSQVGVGRSIDGQLLHLSGLYPTTNKVFSMKYPGNTYHTIAEAMKKRDAATRSYLLSEDKPFTWNQNVIAPVMGIDTLLSRQCWRLVEMIGRPAKLSDGQFVAQSIEKMQAGEVWPVGSPGYVQMLTYTMHHPFLLPENLKTISISEPDLPERLVDYMTVAAYTDSALRCLVEYLRTRPDYDDTMIVLVGDHEALGTYRQQWRRNPRVARLVPDAQEVPLIVVNSPVGGRIDRVIGQADVYSTIVELMGLRPYAWPGMGWSALAPRPDSSDPHWVEAPEISRLIIRFDLLAP